MKTIIIMSLIFFSSCSSPEVLENTGEPFVYPNPFKGSFEYTAPYGGSGRYVRITNIPVNKQLQIFNSKGDLVKNISTLNGPSYYQWDLTDMQFNQIKPDLYKIRIDDNTFNTTYWLNLEIEKIDPPRLSTF